MEDFNEDILFEDNENPNINAHNQRHQKLKKMGGNPGGRSEGAEHGSRGDSKHNGSDSHDFGSRTSKK